MFLGNLFIVPIHFGKVKGQGQRRENAGTVFGGNFAAYRPIYFSTDNSLQIPGRYACCASHCIIFFVLFLKRL